jgi:hypothetical protein
MEKLSAKVKRPLWVAGLNIALALTVGSTQAFADTHTPITNQTELEEIGASVDTLAGSYVVTASFEVDPTDGDTYVSGTFTGTFDGGGFTISGLTKPLFEVIDGDDSGPVVKHISDLTLEAAESGVSGSGILAVEVYTGTVIDNVDVTGNVFGENSVGGLVGYNEGTISNSSAIGDVDGAGNVGGLVGYSDGTINNSYATGAVTGIEDYVGGLVGYSSGEISNSYATGAVSGDNYVGGFVGSTGVSPNNSLINNSYATGDVIGSGEYIGGLVGDSYGTITNSYATGDVDGFGDVGGLVGYNGGTISNSSATGAVTGDDDNIGGLVGFNEDGNISNSYATGAVTGDDDIGGLVGENEDGNISNSYATGAVTGDDDIGGLVGENEDGNISNSYATGAVTGDDDIGGLVGDSDYGNISNSYATGAVTGDDDIGGLVGDNDYGNISNSYATGAVTGDSDVGGLVGGIAGDISNSYATGTVTGDLAVGGLVGALFSGAISNSYATGAVTGDGYVGGLVGENGGAIDEDSYATGAVNDASPDVSPLSPTELLNILNTGSAPDSPIFALVSNLNSGQPYLISNPPLADEVVAGAAQINFSFLSTQVIDVLKKSVGFKAAKSDLSELDLALLGQVKDTRCGQIIGGKLFTNQSLLTFLSVCSLLQLEINYVANKSLEMWVKSSDDQYVLVGDVTFDKDGNAVLPGIEFKKSGQYELIFVNSDKKDLTQPELVNKVSGLTVYVN